MCLPPAARRPPGATDKAHGQAFLTEADVVELRPLVVEELASGSFELWVLEVADGASGWMGLSGSKIEGLFLAPEARGQRGGRRLVEHAQELRGGPLTVDVNEQNPAARDFHARLGFVVLGRSEDDGHGRPFPLLHLERPNPVSGLRGAIGGHPLPGRE